MEMDCGEVVPWWGETLETLETLFMSGNGTITIINIQRNTDSPCLSKLAFEGIYNLTLRFNLL